MCDIDLQMHQSSE